VILEHPWNGVGERGGAADNFCDAIRLEPLPVRTDKQIESDRSDHLTNPLAGTVPSHIRYRTSRCQRPPPQALIAVIALAWRQILWLRRPQRHLKHCERARKSRLHSKRCTRG